MVLVLTGAAPRTAAADPLVSWVGRTVVDKAAGSVTLDWPGTAARVGHPPSSLHWHHLPMCRERADADLSLALPACDGMLQVSVQHASRLDLWVEDHTPGGSRLAVFAVSDEA